MKMNKDIWFPNPANNRVEYRLVRKFPQWQVEAWTVNQCILSQRYCFKSNAQKHISIAIRYEKSRHLKSNLKIKDADNH
jgi:hypothetical protein